MVLFGEVLVWCEALGQQEATLVTSKQLQQKQTTTNNHQTATKKHKLQNTIKLLQTSSKQLQQNIKTTTKSTSNNHKASQIPKPNTVLCFTFARCPRVMSAPEQRLDELSQEDVPGISASRLFLFLLNMILDVWMLFGLLLLHTVLFGILRNLGVFVRDLFPRWPVVAMASRCRPFWTWSLGEGFVLEAEEVKAKEPSFFVAKKKRMEGCGRRRMIFVSQRKQP